jgi:hypothetical protein
MANLLDETLEVLKDNGKKSDDVKWVGCDDIWFSFFEFSVWADFDYDSGYGGQIVNYSLVVVGEDWWLERHEYDGSECWEFKQLPNKPESKDKSETYVKQISRRELLNDGYKDCLPEELLDSVYGRRYK